MFESGMFRPLDLARATRDQHGAEATVVSTTGHLYDWRARVKVEENEGEPDVYRNFPLDVGRAAREQYGAKWRAVAVGVHRYDWRAVRLSDFECMILPVMLVACDRFYDISGVHTGLQRFRTVLEYVQGWYKLRAGATFKLVQPIVLPTRSSSERWNALSIQTDSIPEERFILHRTEIDEYERTMPTPDSKLCVVLGLYTGDSAALSYGAASSGSYVALPPRGTSVNCPSSGPLDAACSDAAYALGHELGHTFGLAHSCDADGGFPDNPQCHQSIMETVHPPDAILLDEEIEIVLGTCFFPSPRRRRRVQPGPLPHARVAGCALTSRGATILPGIRGRALGRTSAR